MQVKSQMKEKRIYALDGLRAIMMLLGVVLHSSESYLIGDNDTWPREPEGDHILMNYLNSLIHVFRMPIFFMVAGFFGSMLFYTRGGWSMVTHRIKRIAFPFVVFLLVLHPIIILTLQYTTMAFGVNLEYISTSLTSLPDITYHLWFLYYLVIITLIFVAIGTLTQQVPALGKLARRVFEWSFSKTHVSWLVFSFLLFVIMLYRWDYSVPTPLKFTPNTGALLFFGLFYCTGWGLFKVRHRLNQLMRNDGLFFTVGLLAYSTRFIWASAIDDVLIGAIHAVVTWLFVFGITGLFIRYFSMPSYRMRYISDSSYWVYLIHLPLTIFIPGMLATFHIPVLIKFLLTLIGTLLLCFLTYHLMVRATVIGKFLNGRKYPVFAKVANPGSLP